MDVILDSNIFLSDIRMESISFKNLFDYLRRTDSVLVIPHLVREEVVYRQADHLHLEGKKVSKAIESFNRLVVEKHSRIHFSVPNPKHERLAIRKRFLAFPKGIKVEIYTDLGGIDVREIYLRGITRRRPADVKGEELRDVILWMIAMQYCFTTKRDTAFISRDGGFWDGEALHEQIQRDIENLHAPISVFPSVDSFIRKSAPPPRDGDLAEIQALFDLRTLEKELIPALSAAFRKRYSANSLNWQLREFTLDKAIVYDINQNTSFAELTYLADGIVESSINTYPMMTAGMGPLAAIGGFNQVIMAQPLNPLGILAPQPEIQGPRFVRRWHRADAKIRVLLRVLNKKVSEAEIDSAIIENILEIDPASLGSASDRHQE
jgi:hypothetical protein